MCGTNDDTIQQRLLTKLGLIYKKSLEMAQNLEATRQDMRELHPTTSSSNVINKVTQAEPETKSQRKLDTSCYHCGNLNTSQPAACSKKQFATSVAKWVT